MKRLLVLLAMGGLTTSSEDNCELAKSWPFPLSAALCHGSRIMVSLDGVSSREFMNLLVFGDPQKWNWDEQGVPAPLAQRIAATHGVTVGSGSFIHEVRHKPTSVMVLRNQHLGVDLPLGGIGNPFPTPVGISDELSVGPSGTPY